MIELIPSLSILGGKCVRLTQGDYNNQAVYKENPIDIAKRFEDHGIRKLHLIDLDGARTGNVVNYYVLEGIAGHTSLQIDFGGGITTDGDLNKVLEFGAKMVTVGTIAVTNPDLFMSWIISYGRSKIIMSADVVDDKVVIRGRQRDTKVDIMEHVERFHNTSLSYLKCADVSKDGLMEGPAFDLYKKILAQFPDIKLMASAGVGSMDDVRRLEEIGVYGVIIGKAFYEDRITLKDMETYIAQTQS